MATRRSLAIIMGMMMIVAAGISMMPVADDVDATTTEGGVKVQYYDGNSWSSRTVVAYNLYKAVIAANTGEDNERLNYTLTFATGATDWQKTEQGISNPNENYGTIATVNGSGAFTVFVYTSTWEIANPAIGWYRPYADYASAVKFSDSDHRSAGSSNIAIVVGTVSTIPAGSEATIPLTPIAQNATYMYTFVLKDLVGSVAPTTWPSVSFFDFEESEWRTKVLSSANLRSTNGIKVRGYGSDAYLALKNALGSSNVIGQETVTKVNSNSDGSTYLTYYSWMDKVLGSGTISNSDTNDDGSVTTTYKYWASYTSTGAYLQYTLGYYSGIAGASNQGVDFRFYYEQSVWTTPAPSPSP